MDHNTSAVIAQVVAKLQGLLGKSTGPAAPKEASLPEFDAALKKCVERAQTLSPEIIKLTSLFESAARTMKLILGYSSVCKKFSQDQEKKLQEKFKALSKQTEDLERKGVDYIDHCKAVRELLSSTFWVFVQTPEFLLKGAIESADFCAIKFQRKKNQDHNEWYKLLQIAVRALEKAVMEGYQTGITFNFNGTDKWNDLIEGNGPAPAAEEVKKEAPKQVEAVKAPVKKTKKRDIVGQTHNLSYFEDEKIEFKAGELEMRNAIFFENSKNVVLSIEPKFKSIVISRCQGFVLNIRNCVSGIEIVGCKDVRVFVHERTPSISVDSSQGVRVVLNEKNLECDIVSSKASELTIAYEKEDGNETKPFTVGEQFITKWNAKSGKFETTLYDKFL